MSGFGIRLSESGIGSDGKLAEGIDEALYGL
jgi:hypothetical protein